MDDIKSKFDHILAVISSKKFLRGQILCNDIPIFIVDYEIEQEADIIKMRENLIERLRQQNINVLPIDLYDLSMRVLQQDQGDWKWLINPKRTNEEIADQLPGILKVETVVHAVTNMMREHAGQYDMIFFNGCGHIFPFLRTHIILNNLHREIEKPVVVFFPGTCDSQGTPYSSFRLFGKVTEGHDYRAANISHIKESIL
jgi:hypothetical protein